MTGSQAHSDEKATAVELEQRARDQKGSTLRSGHVEVLSRILGYETRIEISMTEDFKLILELQDRFPLLSFPNVRLQKVGAERLSVEVHDFIHAETLEGFDCFLLFHLFLLWACCPFPQSYREERQVSIGIDIRQLGVYLFTLGNKEALP